MRRARAVGVAPDLRTPSAADGLVGAVAESARTRPTSKAPSPASAGAGVAGRGVADDRGPGTPASAVSSCPGGGDTPGTGGGATRPPTGRREGRPPAPPRPAAGGPPLAAQKSVSRRIISGSAWDRGTVSPVSSFRGCDGVGALSGAGVPALVAVDRRTVVRILPDPGPVPNGSDGEPEGAGDPAVGGAAGERRTVVMDSSGRTVVAAAGLATGEPGTGAGPSGGGTDGGRRRDVCSAATDGRTGPSSGPARDGVDEVVRSSDERRTVRNASGAVASLAARPDDGDAVAGRMGGTVVGVSGDRDTVVAVSGGSETLPWLGER
jgi:hypothetical protein